MDPSDIRLECLRLAAGGKIFDRGDSLLIDKTSEQVVADARKFEAFVTGREEGETK